MHSSHKLKMGYRRTESDPACTTVNDIRCKFEATGDAVKSPELGLAFGVKQRTSNPSSTASSPLVQRKIGIPEYANASQIKTLASQNKIGKQANDWKLDKSNSANLSLSQPVQLKQADTKVTADKHRSEEHTSELQSHVRISYAVFCLKKKKKKKNKHIDKQLITHPNKATKQ